MKLRIIQWNIKINSKTDGIAEFLLSKLEGNTVVGLQEVSETAYEKISTHLQHNNAFSLHLRTPGKYEGRNRRMGVMVIASGGEISNSQLVDCSVFPERTLVAKIKFDGLDVNALSFHSLTGVDYKKAKSSNFASIASFLDENPVDIFTCDANEPQIDTFDEENVVCFDNRDKGEKASLLFGKTKVHSMIDTYKEIARRSNLQLEDGYTHILNGGKKKRYDFVYCNKAWKILSSKVYYEDAIAAGSDHGMVVTDVLI